MDFSIVLPALNEAENLPHVIKELKSVLSRMDIEFEIIAVDDNSSDSTWLVLQLLKKKVPELKIIKLESSLGYGNAVLAGLSASHGKILGFMDSDRQFDPENLAAIYFKLQNEKLDLCKGTRIVRHDNIKRKFTSLAFCVIFNVIFASRFKDINAKPKIFRREVYKNMSLSSKDWFLDAEIMLKAKRCQYKIGEVYFAALPRKKGRSKVRLKTIFEFMGNIIRHRLFSNFYYKK